MKTYIFYFILIFSLLQYQLFAQNNKAEGRVFKYNDDNGEDLTPLEFVNILWAGTNIGTITDSMGNFSLERINSTDQLIINYVGFKNDTITVNKNEKIEVVLLENTNIEEVTILKRFGGSYISKLNPLHTEVITSEGLQKLACCNLAESFENSATVDVGFTDAVSGARKIKMLGLAGEYAQILSENVPSNRGLVNTFVLDYIPGTWMESIYVSKGTASVTNGYESITGQINIEYKKPEESEKLFVNLFGNTKGRLESNLNSAIALNNKVSTGLFLHTSMMQNEVDDNDDGFLDIAMKKQVNIFNRWTYKPQEEIHIQFGVKALYEEREGGQKAYYENHVNPDLYGFGIDNINIQVFNKSGMGFHHKPYKSIGLISSFTYHDMKGFFGNTDYDADQKSFYSNLIYQSIIFNTNHKFNVGASIVYDEFNERYNDTLMARKETVPGVFGQYTFSYLDIFTFIAGLRFDHNSYYQRYLVTPRMHMKYNLTNNTILRASFGKGYRSAIVIAENIGLLASSRSIRIAEALDMEEALNYGLNFHQVFKFGPEKKIEILADYYRTGFQNIIVVDKESDITFINFYNLQGKAYSNSYQVELRLVPLNRMDITFAYRLNDVKTTINNELKRKPLVNKHKGLILFSYATKFDIWKINITNQFVGRVRLPETHMYPLEYRKGDHSESYYILHAQLTRRFKYFDVYIGGENITGYKQKDPIISADDPYGPYFDASNVWGPVHGSIYYAGIRFILN